MALALVRGCLRRTGAREDSYWDPVGDDNGPGTYTYPTDAVYKRGSFDLTELKVKSQGRQGGPSR
jgi:hypothetical protein